MEECGSQSDTRKEFSVKRHAFLGPNGQKLRFETAGIGDNLLGNGRWIMADDKGLARSDNMWTKTSDIFCQSRGIRLSKQGNYLLVARWGL